MRAAHQPHQQRLPLQTTQGGEPRLDGALRLVAVVVAVVVLVLIVVVVVVIVIVGGLLVAVAVAVLVAVAVGLLDAESRREDLQGGVEKKVVQRGHGGRKGAWSLRPCFRSASTSESWM